MEPNIAGLADREVWLLAILLNQRFDHTNISYIFRDLTPRRIERLERYFNSEQPDLVWDVVSENTIADVDALMLQNPVVADIFRRKGAVEKLYKEFKLTGRNPYKIPFDKDWKE